MPRPGSLAGIDVGIDVGIDKESVAAGTIRRVVLIDGWQTVMLWFSCTGEVRRLTSLPVRRCLGLFAFRVSWWRGSRYVWAPLGRS